MGITPTQPAKAEDFINEGERNADKSQDAGRVPKLESDGFLDSRFVKQVIQLETFASFDGSVTPKAVYFNSADGKIGLSDADDDARFSGFSDSDTTPAAPQYLGGAAVGSSSSFLAPAGANRYLVVFTYHLSSVNLPDSMEWNGFNLVNLGSRVSGSTVGCTAWGVAIGDAVSDETFTLNIVGSSASNTLIHNAMVYGGVDQSSPFNAFSFFEGFSGSASGTITADQNDIVVAGGISQGVNISISGSGIVKRFDARADTGDVIPASGDTSLSLTGGSNTTIGIGISLAPAPAPANYQYAGIVSGFTGLTPGAYYYLQDTGGEIGLTPGTSSVPVGVAVSAEELFIVPYKKSRFAHGSGTTGDKGDNGAFVDIVVNCGFQPSIIRGAIGVYAGSQNDHYDAGSYIVEDGTYRSAGINFTGTSAIVGREHTMTFIDISDTGFTVRLTQTNASPDTTRYYFEAQE